MALNDAIMAYRGRLIWHIATMQSPQACQNEPVQIDVFIVAFFASMSRDYSSHCQRDIVSK